MRRWVWVWVLLGCAALMAQETPTNPNEYTMTADETREFRGMLSDGYDMVFIRVRDVPAGATLYLFAEGYNGVDAYMRVFSADLTTMLAADDDSGGQRRAAIAYTTDGRGDLFVNVYAANGAAGGYRVVVGVNDPQVHSALNIALTQQAACTPDPSAQRPQLSGPLKQIGSERVLIHYTLNGADATTDYYAAQMLEALELSLDVQFEQLGWRQPPSDCGVGGDNRLDVYIRDIEFSAVGYAYPETIVGDNPNTPEREFFAASSYLVIDNDMSFVKPEEALTLMKTTAVHEVHHNIQFGYDTSESYFGFYESGATWIETLVTPDETDAYEYDAVFAHPDLCIGSEADENGTRIYAEWVMIDSIARDLGLLAYQRLWEFLALEEGLNAFYLGLGRLGAAPETIIRRMAIRNLLLDYAHAQRFERRVAIEATADALGAIIPMEDGVQQQSVDYISVKVGGVLRFERVGGANLRLTLVGIDSATQTATSYNLGGDGVVDTRPYDSVYLIVQNTTRHSRVEDCYFTDWGVIISDGSGLPLTPADADVWNASNYRPS
jgi:hypothetical protein